jgi:hypothetical protein
MSQDILQASLAEWKNFTAPMLELSVTHEGTQSIVRVFGVLKVDDHLFESLHSLTTRFGFTQGLHDWVYSNSLQLMSVSSIELDDAAAALIGKPALHTIYQLLKQKRHGHYLTYQEIQSKLPNGPVEEKTIGEYLNRLSEETGIDLERPRGQKKVRLPI